MTNAMFVGGVTSLEGSCPVCGRTVNRLHSWGMGAVCETYACAECGETRYGGAEGFAHRGRPPLGLVALA